MKFSSLEEDEQIEDLVGNLLDFFKENKTTPMVAVCAMLGIVRQLQKDGVVEISLDEILGQDYEPKDKEGMI